MIWLGMKQHFALLALLAAAVLVPSRPAVSQGLSPGIIGDDDRVRLDQQGPPWDAVGQVNVSTYRMAGQCTGTLVAPNVVITAAHCIIDPFKKKPFPLHDIHFLAGVRGSDNLGHETAECLHFPEDYSYIGPDKILPTMPARPVPAQAFQTDAVAIVLKGALTVDPAPLAESISPEPGLRLVHVAYPADHRFLPWADFNCHLLRSDPKEPLWLNDCDTHVGSSGGPLFVEEDGNYKLAAIMLGSAKRMFNIAMPVSKWGDLARNTTCP